MKGLQLNSINEHLVGLWVQYSVVGFVASALVVLTWFSERSQVHKSSPCDSHLKHWRVPIRVFILPLPRATLDRRESIPDPPPFARVEKEWGGSIAWEISSPFLPTKHGHRRGKGRGREEFF